MVNIARKTQKIFASLASNTGVFGSAADNTKILSNDLNVLQSKPAFLQGWVDAVLGTKKFPALEEFQAMDVITTQQIAYILQKGIPEYDSGTTYYTSCVVREPNSYQLYGSISDDNVGHPLNDAVNWEPLISLDFVVAPATETVAGIAEVATAPEAKAGTRDDVFITPAKLKALLPPTGVVYAYALGTTAPEGHVMVGGRTIGNAASGATERANADTVDLFTGLWNAFSNTLLPIQDNAGVATTRGVSAAVDFAAGKRLPTLDARGRVLAGLDNMGGTAAGRLTGQPYGVNGLVIGASGGEESHTQTLEEMPPHTHEADVENTTGATKIVINYEVRHFVKATAVYSAGGGLPHNNVQPTLILPFIMRL